MAGTIRFALNNDVTGSDAAQKTRASFFWVANFLDNHAAYSRVASYYGGGTGWLDSGEKTFGVWRNNSSSYGAWDVFVGWSYNNVSSDAAPFWLVQGFNYGVSIGIAQHSSSVAWQGTTNNNGTDTFGTNVAAPWKSGSLIFPASNSRRGGQASNNNGMSLFRANAETDTSRIHCTGDNDNLAFLYSEANNSVFDHSFFFLEYMPVTSSYDFPYLFLAQTTDINTYFFARNTAYTEYQTGVATQKTGALNRNTTYPAFLEFDTMATDPLMPLNFETGKIYEYPILVGMGTAAKEFVGHTTFVRAVSNRLASRDRLGSAARLVAGNLNNSPNVSASIPWDGSTNPGGGSSQSGTNDFVTSSAYGIYHTASITALASVTTITNTVTVSVSSSNDLWRYFETGTYFFSASFPTGKTDIVKVR